jgi:hypothetical protein
VQIARLKLRIKNSETVGCACLNCKKNVRKLEELYNLGTIPKQED